MISYLKFKKLYPNTSYKKYFMNNIKYNFKKFIRIPYCCYMCIKYPFLYPRNRFNGLHYNNWKIQNFLTTLVKKYNVSKFGGEGENHKLTDLEKETFKKNLYYFKEISSHMIVGWTNWWAKPLHSLIKFYHNYILQFFHCIPTSTEWDCMGMAWKKAFGKQYLDELKEAAIKDGYLKSLRIMQLKEKWGRCQLYLNMYGDNVFNVIQKYEDLSWNTCIKCGKPATHTSKGWISPYCEDCVNKDNPDRYIKRGTEEEKETFL